jgi:hypothetical protein
MSAKPEAPIPGNVSQASKPDVPHSFRPAEDSLVLTVRWPSIKA